MKIAISTESTSDMTKEMLEEYDVHILPYEILLGDKTFYDGELTTQEMFDYVDKTGTLPKTSAINEFRYTEYFEELKKDYDGVVHISLSSGITSSTNNAINAAKKVKNCYVVDSKSLSTGIALLAIYARKLADKGYDAKKIYEAVSERVPRLQVSFVVERLDYLYKGGRCSSLALLGANLLKIRPRIIVKNDDGKMVSDKKYRGKMEQVVEKYCADTLAEFNNPDKSIGFVTIPRRPKAWRKRRKRQCATRVSNRYTKRKRAARSPATAAPTRWAYFTSTTAAGKSDKKIKSAPKQKFRSAFYSSFTVLFNEYSQPQ